MYDKNYFEERHHDRYADEKFIRYCARLSEIKFPAKGRTLVIGCGYGVDMYNRTRCKCNLYEGTEVEGIDISPDAVEFCKSKYDLKAFVCDAENVAEFYENKELFDSVIISHTLEHLKNPLKVLQETRKVMKDGAELYVAVPTARANPGDRSDGELFLWDRFQLVNLLEEAGFEVLSIKNFSYAGNFIAQHFPFRLGRIVSTFIGRYTRKFDEYVLCAKKTWLMPVAGETHAELSEFLRRSKIDYKKPVWWKEMITKMIRLDPAPVRGNKARILVYCFGHATDRLIPVIKRLYAEHFDVLAMAQDFTARKKLKASHVGFRSLEDWNYPRLKIWPDVKELPDMKSQIIKTLKQWRVVLEDERPALVITNIDSLLVGKCLVKAANSMGIKTLLQQHGLMLNDDIPISSRFVATWGPYFKTQLAKTKFPRKNIFVTGFPLADEILKYKRKPEGIITFFTQGHAVPLVDQVREYEKAKSRAEKEGKRLIFKLHPAEPGALQKRLEHEYKNVEVIRECDVHELISRSDECVTFSSTTALECTIMGVKTTILSDDLRKMMKNKSRMFIKDRKNVARFVKLVGDLCRQ